MRCKKIPVMLLPPDQRLEQAPVGVAQAEPLAILKFHIVCRDAPDPLAAQVGERFGEVDVGIPPSPPWEGGSV